MIRVQNLSFSYADKPLLDQVSFTVGTNQKVGLVGQNGAGKTTVLKLLTQQEQYSEGKIEVQGQIGYVPQEIKYDKNMEESKTVRDYIDTSHQKLDHELQTVLRNLEMNVDIHKPAQNLSGGQKTKLALARALLQEPDILLLDEPTNFMDIGGKKWVMHFLSRYPKTLLLISHDLKLMDKAIDKVLYFNAQMKKIEEYTGNYTKFKKLQKINEDLLKRKAHAEQQHINRMEKSLIKLRRFSSGKKVRQRVQLQERIERLKENLPELPKEIRRIKINLPTPLSVGELPIRAVNIAKSFNGNEVFKDLNFTIVRGQRIALIGPNGAGKSTLIKILVGQLQADTGEVLRNEHISIGYYSQEFETFDFSKTVIETLTDTCHMSESAARPYLGRFMFLGNKIFQEVGSLSGGEKTRLSIALLMGINHNVLILDEPTTYLDVLSQRIILDTLKAYKGTMIIVSHTPEFIKELTPTKAFIMPENKMALWSDDILDKVEEV